MLLQKLCREARRSVLCCLFENIQKLLEYIQVTTLSQSFYTKTYCSKAVISFLNNSLLAQIQRRFPISIPMVCCCTVLQKYFGYFRMPVFHSKVKRTFSIAIGGVGVRPCL